MQMQGIGLKNDKTYELLFTITTTLIFRIGDLERNLAFLLSFLSMLYFPNANYLRKGIRSIVGWGVGEGIGRG